MWETLIGWFVATFLLAPLQAEMAGRLEAGRAPAAVVEQVTRCGADAAPALLTRAAGDPWWAISTAFGTWIGTVRPETLLADAAPSCPAAIAAARPFLAGG